ncbi:MAG: LPS export ABC transporter periplasmic protein LptC [Candidatus Rokuibacteriota bacterium]
MRHLSRVLLSLVVLFVLVVATVMFARSRTMSAESVGPPPSRADLHIKEVRIEEDSENVRWQLRAEQALVFEEAGRTELRKVVVHVHQPERSWTIIGEEGELLEETKDVEVRRNVVVTSLDGLRLETDVLRWHGGDKRLWTDAPVRLTRPGAVVDGTSLDVHMAQDASTVGGRVKATFEPSAKPGIK